MINFAAYNYRELTYNNSTNKYSEVSDGTVQAYAYLVPPMTSDIGIDVVEQARTGTLYVEEKNASMIADKIIQISINNKWFMLGVKTFICSEFRRMYRYVITEAGYEVIPKVVV